MRGQPLLSQLGSVLGGRRRAGGRSCRRCWAELLLPVPSWKTKRHGVSGCPCHGFLIELAGPVGAVLLSRTGAVPGKSSETSTQLSAPPSLSLALRHRAVDRSGGRFVPGGQPDWWRRSWWSNCWRPRPPNRSVMCFASPAAEPAGPAGGSVGGGPANRGPRGVETRIRSAGAARLSGWTACAVRRRAVHGPRRTSGVRRP